MCEPRAAAVASRWPGDLMIREWLAERAHDASVWCLNRSKTWLRWSEFWTDVEVWLSSSKPWAVIRSRGGGFHDDD